MKPTVWPSPIGPALARRIRRPWGTGCGCQARVQRKPPDPPRPPMGWWSGSGRHPERPGARKQRARTAPPSRNGGTRPRVGRRAEPEASLQEEPVGARARCRRAETGPLGRRARSGHGGATCGCGPAAVWGGRHGTSLTGETGESHAGPEVCAEPAGRSACTALRVLARPSYRTCFSSACRGCSFSMPRRRAPQIRTRRPRFTSPVRRDRFPGCHQKYRQKSGRARAGGSPPDEARPSRDHVGRPGQRPDRDPQLALW